MRRWTAMSDTYVQITAVPVDMLDVGTADLPHPQYVVGRYDIELRVVKSAMSLETAQRHLREGTKFRLVEVDSEPISVIHHHHYYERDGQPAIVEHSHPCSNVRHAVPEIDKSLPIYWDHEGSDCNEVDGDE